MAKNETEFTKLIVCDKSGNEYTLEFNARVVKNMERNGFKVDVDYPNMMIDELFAGAFQMHHKGISRDRIREIWKVQNNKDGLLGALTKLYMKPLEDLMDEPEEAEGADPTWKTA